MDKAKPDKAQLTIKSEERLPPDKVGIELGVRILDQDSKPINAQPFKVHADGEILMEGLTNEQGEFSGKRVMGLQDGAKRKVFLVLDDTAVTDWKVVGEEKEADGKERQLTMEVDVRIISPSGTPVAGHPFKIQIDNRTPLHVVTDKNGTYHEEIISDAKGNTRKKISLVLDVNTVKEQLAPKVLNLVPSKDFGEVLSGKRSIKMGEECLLKKEKYTVTGDILVEEGGVLTIEQGAIFEMVCDAGIVCKGVLSITGTKNDPVIFKPSSASPGWKNITLLGSGALGSNLRYCVIEGGKGRSFSKGTDLELIRLTDGKGEKTAGGGLLCLSTDSDFLDAEDLNDEQRINITDVVIKSSSSESGSAIYCYKSSSVIERCLMSGNFATGASFFPKDGSKKDPKEDITVGGTIFIKRSRVKMRFCKITENTGGGVNLSSSADMDMEDCLVAENSRSGHLVGGINLVQRSTARIVHSDIVGNAGGILIRGEATVQITNSKIRNNGQLAGYEVLEGGGFRVDEGSRLNILGCEITGNIATHGGGFYITGDSRVQIVDSKIVRNRAGGDKPGHSGGGLFAAECSSLQITNCHILENQAPTGGGFHIIACQLVLSDSLISHNVGASGSAITLLSSTAKVLDSEITASQSAESTGARRSVITGKNSLATFERSNIEGTWIDSEVRQLLSLEEVKRVEQCQRKR